MNSILPSVLLNFLLLFPKIIAAARICLLSSPSATNSSADILPSLYAGQPVPAIITIDISCHWGPTTSSKKRDYMMRFDVEEMVRDWLVSGRKRGDFTATVSSVDYHYLVALLNALEGWRNFYCTHHSNRVASRRACPAKGCCYSSTSYRRSHHGINGHPKYWDLPGAWCRKSIGAAQRRQNYIRLIDGCRLSISTRS